MVKKFKHKFLQLKAQRDNLLEDLQIHEDKRDYLYTKLENAYKARSIIQFISQQTQRELEDDMSSIVTSSIRSIPFEDDYNFVIEFIERRGKTEADLWLDKDGDRCKPIDSVGGGLCDIVSLGLLLTFKSMKDTRQTIIIDEPLRNLSKNLQQYASQMLKMLCDKLNLQIILVSHNQEIIKSADNVIEF